MTRVLVTGATGMVGSHLIDALLAQGIEIRAYVRPSSDLRHLKSLPVEIRQGDPTDVETLRRTARGITRVFHAAGHVNVGSPFDASGRASHYKTVNTDFTGALLNASLEAGVERFVYVSSSSVYSIKAGPPTAETAPLEPLSDYGRSKLQAEQLVRSYHMKGLNSTIIRPSIIYGPGDRHFLPVALKLASLPVLPLINGGRNLFDLVYVGDVVELMLLASNSASASGQVYNAGAGEPTSLRDLVEAYSRVMGRAPYILSVPLAAVRRTAWLSRRVLARLAPGAEALMTPTGLQLMNQDIHLDMARARADLGFTPRFDLQRGIAVTLEQLQDGHTG